MSLVECLGCKKYPCTIGSDTQKEKLYYDKPFWFCHNCIGCATIENNTIIPEELPPCEQPTEESYIQDVRDVYTKEMANNDQTFNSLDSPPVWNKRIREKVRNCYHKGFLQPEHLKQFAEWEKKINAPDFPKYASRFALFQAAPELCLHVIGF